MSLKGFHIVFISLSILLALGCGFWCIWVHTLENAPGYIGGAVGSFAAAIALFIYGIWFYRKMKRLHLIT